MTQERASAPWTRTFIEHTVTFDLGPVGPVVPVGYSTAVGGAWARLDFVAVHLYGNREPRVGGSGVRCRQDGSPDKRFRGGKVSSPVVVPDPEVWVERAWAEVHSEREARLSDA